MFTTSYIPKKPTTSESKAVKKNIIEEIITLSRDAFLQLDSKPSDAHVFEAGITVRKLDDLTKVCTITRGGKSYIIFGVEKEQQDKVDIDLFRANIAKELKLESSEFSQVVGDSYPFSEEGTRYAKRKMNEFLNSIIKNGILYGATGREGSRADINGIINQLLDEQPLLRNRIIGNVVDEHTIAATKTWGCRISENLTNFMLVYSNTEKPTVKFGDDYISDQITNAIGLCAEGGTQSLKQLTHMLREGLSVLGFTGLREDKDEKNSDPMTKLSYLSACEFLSFIKNQIKNKEVSQLIIEEAIKLYFTNHALFNKNKGKDSDGSTKQGLYEKFYKDFISDKVWEKLSQIKVSSASIQSLSPSAKDLQELGLLAIPKPISEAKTKENESTKLKLS